MKRRSTSDQVPHASEQLADTPAGEAFAASTQDYVPEEAMQWSRSSNLAAPPPRPGYVQGWIRTTLGGEADVSNITRTMSKGEGWRPRQASTIPGGYAAPTLQHGSYGEVIGVAGMVLCERPKRMQEQSDAFYAASLRRQHESIDQDIHKVQRPGHPITQQRTSSVGGAPRPAAFAEDKS